MVRGSAIVFEYEIPGKVCQCDSWYLCTGACLDGEVGGVGDNQRGRRRLHCGDFVGQANLPCFVEVVVRLPGCVDIDLEGAILDTADVLRHGTVFPLYRQVVAEKRGWDRRAKDGGQTWHECAKCIKHRHHLRRVTVAMSRDGAPNTRQGE